MSQIAGHVFLKSGRDKPVRGGNPWIFSQAIDRTKPATLAAGSMVEILDASGALVAYGYYNAATTIALRVLSFGAALRCEEIVEYRIAHAIELRQRFVAGETNCCRLVNGDGDALSGVVIDRYGDVLVVQLLTAGADRMRDEILAALVKLAHPRAIVERSQGAVRKQEGLGDRTGLLLGEPVPEVIVVENGIRVAVDLEHGQKTGYFLDQRENRALIPGLATGARVLDAYCYAGGFALAALKGGARRVVAVDTSARALSWARRNLALNAYDEDGAEFVHGEAPRYLAQNAGSFDLVVLDPPPLARGIKDVPHAAHLYVELNALAMAALAPGGRLMTFSCSVHFGGEDFIRAVRIAQGKSRRNFRLLARLGAGPDHPVLLGHPEGEYLTGLLLADLS
ncbi:MAG: class I SAM-dependent rRNA methyltransferase [Candidatus Binataceae bacterium]